MTDGDRVILTGLSYFGPRKAAYRILVGIWIFFGLAWLAGIVSSIQEAFQNLAKEVEANRLFRKRTAKVGLLGWGLGSGTAQTRDIIECFTFLYFNSNQSSPTIRTNVEMQKDLETMRKTF